MQVPTSNSDVSKKTDKRRTNGRHDAKISEGESEARVIYF